MGDATGVQAVAGRRRAERAAALAAAASYVEDLAGELPVIAAVVFGSYARGDFNTSSDIDVLVVSDALPIGFRQRLDLLWRHRPPGIEPVGWTVAELADRRCRHDPIAVEADRVGIIVAGALP